MPAKKPSWDSTIHDLTVHKLPNKKLREKLQSRKPHAGPGVTLKKRNSTQRVFYVRDENGYSSEESFHSEEHVLQDNDTGSEQHKKTKKRKNMEKSHAEFAKLDIKQMNMNRKKVEERYAKNGAERNTDVQDFMTEPSIAKRRHHKKDTNTPSQLKSLEKAYESIQEEIEEFEKSRGELSLEALEEEYSREETYESEEDNNEASSTRRSSGDSQPGRTVTNEALQEWRNFKKQQQQQERQKKSHKVAPDSHQRRTVLADNFVHEDHHNTEEYPTSQSVTKYWEQQIHQLDDKLSEQSHNSEQLRFEFEQYRRQSENQIGDLTRELHEMRELLKSLMGAQKRANMHQQQAASVEQESRRTTFESHASAPGNSASGPQATLVDESTSQTDDDYDEDDDYDHLYEDEGEYGEDEHEEYEEETLPTVVSKHFHPDRSSPPRNITAPPRTAPTAARTAPLNDSMKQSKPPRKPIRDSKVVRSAVPNPTFSFNVLGRASTQGHASTVSTQPSLGSALPQTPQPSRDVPLPSQNGGASRVHWVDDGLQATHHIHSKQTIPQMSAISPPPINRTPDENAATIRSPERQAKVMQKGSSNPCPVLSPRPSINRNASNNNLHASHATRSQSSTTQHSLNGVYGGTGLQGMYEEEFGDDDGDDATFQPQPVTIFGRDRSNLEPKISSNSGRFEIRKFIPVNSKNGGR